ncbi:hypothetical protein L596_019370 [Steinernema carpocapsae]|uniref:Uncharacterized protein n=1 Tax=Steinernema carpocapsae TaxID=34508 RepID=A0A4V6A0R4_STECR|nr:hypothetical protein L596_019370 [Steinernema carpocapsae]
MRSDPDPKVGSDPIRIRSEKSDPKSGKSDPIRSATSDRFPDRRAKMKRAKKIANDKTAKKAPACTHRYL